VDWEFSFRSADVSKLEHVAAGLRGEFDAVLIQEHVEVVGVDGSVSPGLPLLSAVRRDALSPEEVKEIASRMSSLAHTEGITYEGVSAYQPADEEDLFGWLTIEDAIWRLRHFSDTGLAPDAALPWAFLIVAKEMERLQEAADALGHAGYESIVVFEDQNEDGLYECCVFVDGRNSESKLSEKYKQISEAARQYGAQVQGVQFFSEDALRGDDSEDGTP